MRALNRCQQGTVALAYKASNCACILSVTHLYTTGPVFCTGSGEVIDWVKLGWTSLGTFACAASANTLNQVYEIANDARMERTKWRPLPTGRLSRGHALVFAGVAGSVGIYTLATQVSILTSI